MRSITGPLARVGPNDLVNDDPEFARRIFGARSQYIRADWYDSLRFHPEKNNVLTHRDEEEHGKLRSKMAAGVSVFHYALLSKRKGLPSYSFLFF